MAFQKEVRAKTAELEGQITVTRGSNEHLEGDEITVEFKADSMMQIAEDELMR